MRYWWVNQNQTFAQELAGGYLWSPKRNKAPAGKAVGARNQFYENMREVSPGDVIFSFCNREIPTIAIARSYCYGAPKPEEFGKVGGYWGHIGWKVEVAYIRLQHVIRPRDHMELIRPLLPQKYSPLQPNGDGLQGVYLAELPGLLGQLLINLIGKEAAQLVGARETFKRDEKREEFPDRLIQEWEDLLEDQIAQDPEVQETQREAIIHARKGQGLFRRRLMKLEDRCRITLVANPDHLIGSHIKPWRDSDNNERLDGENGLLLTPSADHLFDRGFISFENNGDLIISPVADQDALRKMGVSFAATKNVGDFSSGQKEYLDFHRSGILLQVR